MPKKPMRIPPVPPVRELRKLEIAYVEALVNGVRAGDALRRYRPEHFERALDQAHALGVDPSRHLRSVVRAVNQDVCKVLAFEARRRGLHGTARGLRMLPRLDITETELVTLAEPAALPVPPTRSAKPRRPTLAAVQEMYPDFSEDDVIAIRDEKYPAEDYAPEGEAPSPALPRAAGLIVPKFTPVPPKADGRQRVVRLARACLERLATPRPPSPVDFLQVWMPTNLAALLSERGILTVQQLMVRVSTGPDWYEQPAEPAKAADGAPSPAAATTVKALKAIGPVKARLLEDWLREHHLMPSRAPRRWQAHTPALPAASAAQPPCPCGGRIVVLEDPAAALRPFTGVPSLNGSSGKHRIGPEKSLLTANTDLEAISAWLDTLKSPATFRNYRREAVRLALWATLKRHKPMSSLDIEDCTAYIEFLRAIPPDWRCEPEDRRQELLSVRWRPFDRPALSERSIGYAVTVLQRLYRWLNDVRYLGGNPWKGLGPKHRGAGGNINAEERHLPQHLADEVLARVGEVDESAKDAVRKSRRRIVCGFLFEAGLRRQELADLTFGCAAYVGTAHDGMSPYELRFLGKGQRKRNVPITSRMHTWMQADLRLRGHLPDVTAAENESVPVVGRVIADDRGCVRPERIYDECRAALREVAAELDAEGRGDEATLLRKATTHWARHTFATTVVKNAPIQVAQSLLGHADISTTTIYTNVGAEERAGAIAASRIVNRG